MVLCPCGQTAKRIARGPDEPTRFGIVASRKAGSAVERNRAKRLLRELFRRRASLFPDHLDCVVVVRQGAHELGFAEVEAEIARAQKKLAAVAARLAASTDAPPPPRKPRSSGGGD